MKILVLLILIILLAGYLPAQTADTILAEKYFKLGEALSRKSQKQVEPESKLDSLNIQEVFDQAILDSANQYFLKAQEIYKNDKRWTRFLDCKEKYSRNLRRARLFDSAISNLRDGLKYIENNSDSTLEKYYKYYFILGSYYHLGNVVDSAIIYYEQALKYASAILPKNDRFIAVYHVTLGDCYTYIEKFDSALYHYNFVLDSLNSDCNPKSYPISSLYHKLSYFYRDQYNYDKAIEYMQKAIDVYKINISSYISAYTNDLGNLYNAKGEYDKALEYYHKSLEYRKKEYGENHFSFGTLYKNIASIYTEKGDYNNSLEYLNKSLFVREKKYGKTNTSVSQILTEISHMYYKLNDIKHGLLTINRALEINRLFFNEYDSRNLHTYNIASLLYGKNHKFSKAEYYIQKCLDIEQKFSNNKISIRSAYYHYTKGIICLSNKLIDRAIESFQISLAGYSQLLWYNHPIIIKLNNELGDAYTKKNQYEKALEYFNTAIEINKVKSSSNENNAGFDNVISEYNLFISLKGKCYSLSKLYKEKENIDLLQQCFNTNLLCIDLFYKLRFSYKSDSSKVFLTENSFDIFDLCIESALELFKLTGNNNYKETAFHIAERSKNGILNGVLAENKAKKYASIPDSLLKYEESLQKEIENYNILVFKELEKNEPDSIKIEYWQNKLFSLKQEFQTYSDRLEVNFPKYYNFKFRTDIITIPEIQQALDNETVVVEYFTGKNSIKVFTISQKEFNVVTIPVDSLFDRAIIKLYKTLKKQGNLIQKKNHIEFIQNSSYIYSQIIAPIYSSITAKKHLLIVPDGKLFYIPFEILLEKPKQISKFSEYDYLIKKHEVSYHYSSSLCFEKENTISNNYDCLFTGFAPMFNESVETHYFKKYRNAMNNFDSELNDQQRQKTERLIFAEKEVKEIDELFKQKGEKSSIFLDENAIESNFKNVSKNSPSKFLHIATHGIANEVRPNLSALLFTQKENSSSDDGTLFAEEILNMNIKSDLVVLSACESGIGKYVKGEGMMAINRSFLYAGVRKLIFSLWKVSDKHTCSLMIEFYKNILEGLPYGTALRNAKLKMLSEEITAVPSNWSTFILIGK